MYAKFLKWANYRSFKSKQGDDFVDPGRTLFLSTRCKCLTLPVIEQCACKKITSPPRKAECTVSRVTGTQWHESDQTSARDLWENLRREEEPALVVNEGRFDAGYAVGGALGKMMCKIVFKPERFSSDNCCGWR